MLRVSRHSSAGSSDAAVDLHSALLGCLEVWLPMEVRQCPSALFCTQSERWLASRHAAVWQSGCSPDPLFEKRHTSKEVFSSASVNDQKHGEAGA